MPRGNRGPDRFVGILNVDKPRGVTSHDVVDHVRRAARMRRVGHAGTLDPEATGVLLVVVGAATRLSDLLMAGTKQYRGVIRFGATSTTDDAAGEITPSAETVALGETELRLLLQRFVGEITQVPPAFSAIKVAGQSLYKRARQGQAVEVPSRTVRIERIDLLEWNGRDLSVEVTCSRGTYIRALARDLGVAVGTGAYLASLVRAASGQFTQADAVTLEEVAEAGAGGYLGNLLYPLDAAGSHLPALLLSPDEVERVYHGGVIARPGTKGHAVSADGRHARGYDVDRGRLVAILLRNGDVWQPEKVFPNYDGEDGGDDVA